MLASIIFGAHGNVSVAVRRYRADPVALRGQFAKLALERFATLAVAGIARRIGNRFMLAVTKVVNQFGIQSFLDQQLGQLLEQPFSHSGFRISCNPPAGRPAVLQVLYASLCSLCLKAIRQFPANSLFTQNSVQARHS